MGRYVVVLEQALFRPGYKTASTYVRFDTLFLYHITLKHCHSMCLSSSKKWRRGAKGWRHWYAGSCRWTRVVRPSSVQVVSGWRGVCCCLLLFPGPSSMLTFFSRSSLVVYLRNMVNNPLKLLFFINSRMRFLRLPKKT